MRVVRVGLIAAALAASTLMTASVGHGSTVLEFSHEELTRRADVILHGRCTSSHPKPGEGEIITTEYEFEVIEALKGTLDKTFRFRALGGTIEGRTFGISGSPTYALDEEVVLFLDVAHPKTGCRHAIGLAQGKFSVREEADTRKKYLVRDLGGLQLTDAAGKVVKEGGLEAETGNRLYLDAFVTTIKAFVAKAK
jgi:hypothetical protein